MSCDHFERYNDLIRSLVLEILQFRHILGVVAMSHQKKPMRGHFPSAVYDINDENLCFRSNDNFLAGCEKNFGPVDNPI